MESISAWLFILVIGSNGGSSGMPVQILKTEEMCRRVGERMISQGGKAEASWICVPLTGGLTDNIRR